MASLFRGLRLDKMYTTDIITIRGDSFPKEKFKKLIIDVMNLISPQSPYLEPQLKIGAVMSGGDFIVIRYDMFETLEYAKGVKKLIREMFVDTKLTDMQASHFCDDEAIENYYMLEGI